MSDLRENLIEAVLERSKLQRIEITPRRYEDLLRNEVHLHPRVYAGASHLTFEDERRKYIVFNEYPVPTGELAREYLRQCWLASPWKSLPPVGIRTSHPYWKKRAPLYSTSVRHRSLAYVDIHHAYWELLRPYCADHVLTPDDREVPGIVPFIRSDEVDADRRLRHAVVGALFAHEIAWMSFGEWISHPLASKTANPSLARICFDTLHAIARDVQRHFETFAWLTDACIVARRDGEAVVDFLRDRWALSSRVVAEGMGAVWSPSTYRVGPKASMDVVNKTASYGVVECRKVARVNVTKERRRRLAAIA